MDSWWKLRRVVDKHSVSQTLKSGGILVEMTSSSPTLALKIHEKAKEKGVAALDAPVSGGG